MKIKKIHLIILLIILSCASLFIGVSDISLQSVFSDPEKRNVFFISRLPRLISILVVGAGMSVSGVVMQQISANKFVSPTTAGTLDFTKLGVLIAIMFIPSAAIGIKMLFAFVFALAGSWLFMLIINNIKIKDVIFVPLVGMMFGGIIQSVTTFIAYKNDLIQNINSWLQGRFALIIAGRYELVLIGIPILVLIYIYADRFTIAGMGDEASRSLGLNYRMVVNLGLVLCSLMSAAVVVTVGSIPFVGVIIPNIISIYMGDNVRKSLPYTALTGSMFLLCCDMLGRVIIYPYEVSIGVTAGTIGSAIFLYLILKGKKRTKATSTSS